MHSVMLQLDLRTTLTRWFGLKTCVVRDEDVIQIAKQVREILLCRTPEREDNDR